MLALLELSVVALLLLLLQPLLTLLQELALVLKELVGSAGPAQVQNGADTVLAGAHKRLEGALGEAVVQLKEGAIVALFGLKLMLGVELVEDGLLVRAFLTIRGFFLDEGQDVPV